MVLIISGKDLAILKTQISFWRTLVAKVLTQSQSSKTLDSQMMYKNDEKTFINFWVANVVLKKDKENVKTNAVLKKDKENVETNAVLKKDKENVETKDE